MAWLRVSDFDRSRSTGAAGCHGSNEASDSRTRAKALTYPVAQISGDIEQNVRSNICKEFIARNLLKTQRGFHSSDNKGRKSDTNEIDQGLLI